MKDNKEETAEKTLTFWEHLDELRSVIIKAIVAIILFSVVVFCFKDLLFDVILAPRTDEFISFRIMGVGPFSLHLMNTGLTEQFMIHMKIAITVGFLLAAPYIIWLLFRYVSPALYDNERRYATVIVGSAYLMFMLGVVITYFLVFPLTVRFLGTYQVSPVVDNMLTLQSYVDTLLMLSLLMGIVFELPVLCWILAKAGFINAKMMSRYRRHVIVGILIVAAFITPTTDIFTLFIVSLPIWLLYELSILMVRKH